ncbi:MAG: PIF1 family DEAD/DEAH box helicase [Candidatus Levyibacteriota bacterium]
MTQPEALDVLKTGNNVFLTGSAGSGKTHVLNRYIEYLKLQNKTIGITASTGVAATHINGMTINAWAGMGVKQSLTTSDITDLLKRKYLRDRLGKTKVLIIDEVSMLSVQTFELINEVLQAFKGNILPFGGIQMVLCGDFFQLPPIDSTQTRPTTPDSLSTFLYKSPLWHALNLYICYLEKPYRQNDEQFLHLLDQIRHNDINNKTWDLLKHRFFHIFTNGVTPTRLYTHNKHADMVNNQQLAKLSGQERFFRMQTRGNSVLMDIMKRNCLAPEKLVLKKRALVMFVKNNFTEGYANGTMGRIVDFTEKEGYPIVQTFAHKQIIVKPSEWTIEEDGQVLVKITQIPLRLAWAITIHKSQGMSYVALSRVKSLDGIRLRSLNKTALTVNQDIVQVDKQLREQSERVAQELRSSYYYKINTNNLNNS